MAVSHLRGVLGIELLVGEEHSFLIGVPSLQAPAERLKQNTNSSESICKSQQTGLHEKKRTLNNQGTKQWSVTTDSPQGRGHLSQPHFRQGAQSSIYKELQKLTSKERKHVQTQSPSLFAIKLRKMAGFRAAPAARGVSSIPTLTAILCGQTPLHHRSLVAGVDRPRVSQHL